MKWLGCALVGCMLLQGGRATSGEAPTTPVAATADPTVHRHFGFFLRLDTGPTVTFANEPSGSLSGGGWDFGFSIGGALAEDEILAFHTFAAVAFNSLSSSASGSSTSIFALSGFGPEYTHYFMPLNLYLSGSILFTYASLTNSQGTTSGGQTTTVTTTYSSDVGGGLQFEFGKEWWVGDHWGLGMALHYAMSWNHDNTGQIVGSATPGTLFTNSLAFVFSATYN